MSGSQEISRVDGFESSPETAAAARRGWWFLNLMF